MGLILFIVVGGVAGWLASLLVQGGGMGLIGDIIVGIIGAIVGGLLTSLFGGGASLSTNAGSITLGNFLVAVLGAVVFLLVYRLLTRRRGANTV